MVQSEESVALVMFLRYLLFGSHIAKGHSTGGYRRRLSHEDSFLRLPVLVAATLNSEELTMTPLKLTVAVADEAKNEDILEI
jgi:hypothetical protein